MKGIKDCKIIWVKIWNMKPWTEPTSFCLQLAPHSLCLPRDWICMTQGINKTSPRGINKGIVRTDSQLNIICNSRATSLNKKAQSPFPLAAAYSWKCQLTSLMHDETDTPTNSMIIPGIVNTGGVGTVTLTKTTNSTRGAAVLLHSLDLISKVVAYGAGSFYTKTWKCTQRKCTPK